jgi:hypothetical protein
VSNDEPFRGVQLRKHPRLSVSFPLTYVVDGDSVTTDGIALDIGGGGMHFESTDAVPAGSLLTICFGLRTALNMQLRARAVSSSRIPATKYYRHRITFEALPDSIRDTIVAHVNEAWRAELMGRV